MQVLGRDQILSARIFFRRHNPLELVFEDISRFDAENPIVGSLLREIDIKKTSQIAILLNHCQAKRLDRLREINISFSNNNNKNNNNNNKNIRNTIDKTAQVLKSIYFFYGGESEQFVNALEFIDLSPINREFSAFLLLTSAEKQRPRINLVFMQNLAIVPKTNIGQRNKSNKIAKNCWLSRYKRSR